MAGNRAIPINNQTILLEVCEADKKDLEDEVKHMKDIIKSKNLEICLLKSKLRNSEIVDDEARVGVSIPPAWRLLEVILRRVYIPRRGKPQ